MPSRAHQLIEKIHEALDDDTVKAMFGRVAVTKNDQARRVIWVRSVGRFDTAKTKGTAVAQDHLAAFLVHIYAKDDEDAELLLYNLVAAICATVPAGSREIGGDRWRSQEEGEAGELIRTEKIILPVFFRLAVPSEPSTATPQVVTIVNVQDVCGTIQPDGSVVPQNEVP